MCGWSERGVEDGWRVDRNALVSWAWHLRAGPYHARYPRLTFSLEAADRSFIWTAVHQMERERKEERKEGRKEGRKKEKRMLEARHANVREPRDHDLGTGIPYFST